MAVYKADNGTWYVSARYTNWKGESDRKLKRGFATKKEATEWERNFFLENAGNLEMTFEAFYELYKKNMKERVKLNTWKTKESVIEGKILPYFRKKRIQQRIILFVESVRNLKMPSYLSSRQMPGALLLILCKWRQRKCTLQPAGCIALYYFFRFSRYDSFSRSIAISGLIVWYMR